jgi:hypothetical protein
MLHQAISPWMIGDPGAARRMLIPWASGSIMSQRAHFWLRIVGLTVILAAEFGPRIWTSATAPAPSSTTVTAALR